MRRINVASNLPYGFGKVCVAAGLSHDSFHKVP
jgi:hypothetical protein